MIVDFDNPVSVQYMKKSIESFAPVKDILSITPVQCTTPKTLPIRYQENENPIPFYVTHDGNDYLKERFFGGTFDDHPIYQSIMHSHYMLIKRMADGEDDLVVMEHDAALVNEESFRAMYEMAWGNVDGFFPGVCMEFYRLSWEYSQWFIGLLDNFPYTKNRYSGPMGIIHHDDRLGWKHPNRDWLMHCKEYWSKDLVSYGNGTTVLPHEGGHHFPSAVKQFYCTSAKNTNVMNCDNVVVDLSYDEYARSINGERRRVVVIFDEF
jgi:hypothetical protein